MCLYRGEEFEEESNINKEQPSNETLPSPPPLRRSTRIRVSPFE